MFQNFVTLQNDCTITKFSNFYFQKATDKIVHDHFKKTILTINLDNTALNLVTHENFFKFYVEKFIFLCEQLRKYKNFMRVTLIKSVH